MLSVTFSLQSLGPEPLNYAQASLFHGCLMELAAPEGDYGSILHNSPRPPFSQHLEMRDGNWYWTVSFLDGKAQELLYVRHLRDLSELTLKHSGTRILLTERTESVLTDADLGDLFYRSDCPHLLRAEFVTPTAFKSRGEYVIFPTLRHIYQSLMSRYDAFHHEECLGDPETLESLSTGTRIIGYGLRTVPFHLEGIKVTGFTGYITLCHGRNRTLSSLSHALLRFGEYSGVGIKTAMGMGGMRLSVLTPGKNRSRD